MNVPSRKLLLIALVGVFLTQTWFVYLDPIGRAPQLSGQALEGRALWHRHNCQSCHQLFGFGGFLGPDLTNVASRMGGEDGSGLAQRLASILTSGSDRMPAFHFDGQEQLAVATFFRELDRMGVGQVGIPAARSPRQLFSEVVGGAFSGGEFEPNEQAGFELVNKHGCIDCHLPNELSPFLATDLTRLSSRIDPARLRETLANGLPLKGMPNFALSAGEIESIAAFLARLETLGVEVSQSYRTSLRSASGSLSDLPWFEYPR